MSRKNITNFEATGSYSSSSAVVVPPSSPISSAGNDFTAQTTVSTMFYKNGTAGVEDKLFTYNLFKLGTLVWMVLKKVSTSMGSGSQRWVASTAMPSEYWPRFTVGQSFHPVTGLSGTVTQYDSDILGIIRVDTDGIVTIFREPAPGSGAWSGANKGWDSLALAWITTA